MVEHPTVVIVVGLLLWLASCAGVWYFALKSGLGEKQLPPGTLWLGQFREWAGWVLVPAALIWKWRWYRAITGESERNATVLRPARPGLATLMDRRIVAREPVPYELLPRFVWLGAVGLGIAVLLSYWLAVMVGGGVTGRNTIHMLIAVAILSILTVSFATQMLREVFFLWNDDHFIAGKEDEVVAELKEEQRQEAEAEREYERKSLSRGQIALLYGCFGVGFLMLTFLEEKNGIVAFQACVSATIASAVWIYNTRLRPKGWGLGLGVTLIGSVAYVIFTVYSWGLRWPPLVLGLIWGTGIGIASTLLYLRKLRR